MQNSEFDRLNRLLNVGYLKPQHYFDAAFKEYARSPESFSMEQVDQLEKLSKQAGIDWKPSIDVEENKIVGVLNQFTSGIAEGFTTVGWAEDPDSTVEGLANKIGHLIGFAPDIVTGVLSFGASVPISAVKRATAKAGLTKAAKTWGGWLEKGAEAVPLLSRTDKMGKVGLRSIPLRVADFVVDNAGAKLGNAKLLQSTFITRKLSQSEDFKHIAEESARLGVALAVSARKEGPEGWADAAMHGAMAGAFFGGLGRYVYLGKLLGSQNRALMTKATKEIRKTADDVAAEMEILMADGRLWYHGGRLYSKPGTQVPKAGDIKKAPKFEARSEATASGLSEEQVAFATFMLKGGLGASFTGGMATMQRAPLPDQVYEYLLGFFFGAASRPRGDWEATNWLLTKGYPEMAKQAYNQHPLKPEVVNGKIVYKDKGFVDYDYKKIEGYKKLDSYAKDYLKRWEGNRTMDMYNKKKFPEALNRRIVEILEDPAYTAEKAKRGELQFLRDVISNEVERFRSEIAEVELKVDTMLQAVENTDISKVKVADYIEVFDIHGKPYEVEVRSIDSKGKIKVIDRATGNVHELDALDSSFTTINYLHKDYRLNLEQDVFGKTETLQKFNNRKLYDLTLEELRILTNDLLLLREGATFVIPFERLFRAIEVRAHQLKPKSETQAKAENEKELEDSGKISLKEQEQVHDILDKDIHIWEQEVGKILDNFGANDKAKTVIRKLARLKHNDNFKMFVQSVERYFNNTKTKQDLLINNSDAIPGTIKRNPDRPFDTYKFEYYNKDGIKKTRVVNPRQLLQEVYFKERGLSNRKSYRVQLSKKGKNWKIQWEEVPMHDSKGDPLGITATQSYWNNRMRNIFDPKNNTDFEQIISHEFILSERTDFFGETIPSNRWQKMKDSVVNELNQLNSSQSFYAMNLMLSRRGPEHGGPRYISGFNPSNGELITVPFAQELPRYETYNDLTTSEFKDIVKRLTGLDKAKHPDNLKKNDNTYINSTDNKLDKPFTRVDNGLLYEKMRLSNFIYAAEMAGYLDPVKTESFSKKEKPHFYENHPDWIAAREIRRAEQMDYLKEAIDKYIKNPLFKDVAKATKYIKTFYNGVSLQSEFYGKYSFKDGKGKDVVLESILNEEGGFNGVILKDYTMNYTDSNGKQQVFELTDGTKYYKKDLRRRILLETGRIDIETKEADYDAYIKDVILVPENVKNDRGLLINKGAEDSATRAMYELMDANGWDVMIYQSGAKSNSRHTLGEINYNEATKSWEVSKQPEKFTIKPEDIRVIPHEVEIKRDGSAPIHWGLMNKISHRMTDEGRAAFTKLIDKAGKGDPLYMNEVNELLQKGTYKGLIKDAPLDIDKLSIPFIYDTLVNHVHSPLSKDILKNLFTNQNLDVFESSFGRKGAEEIQSLNSYLEKIDYNPYGLLFGNKAMALNSALNNILIKRISRPMIKRGFTSLRLKGYDAEIEAMIKEMNGEGIRENEFYLYNGDKSRDIEYRDVNHETNGVVHVGTLESVYKKWKKLRNNDKYKKWLEEDMMFVITRSPQADEAGIATLKFGGFIDKPGRGIVVKKEVAERLGGADYDGDAVAGYQSIDLAIKNEFLRDSFRKMHYDKNGRIRPLKNSEHDEKFGIVKASDGRTKEQQVLDIFDPEMRYTAGLQAIRGEKDIGLDVNTTQRFRRIFDAIIKKDGKADLNQLKTHALILNENFATGKSRKLTYEEIWDIIRDERTTKQNNSFDALDYIKMKSSEEVAAESFFRYFNIVDKLGNILKPAKGATPQNFVNHILPMTFDGKVDYNALFNPIKKTIGFFNNKEFKVSWNGKEGLVSQQGDAVIGYKILQNALKNNETQIFYGLKYRALEKGKTKNIVLDNSESTRFVVTELNKDYMVVEYQSKANGENLSQKISLRNVDTFKFDHGYFRGLEHLAASENAFNRSPDWNAKKRSEELYNEVDRMQVLEISSKKAQEYFPSDSVQNKIANTIQEISSKTERGLDFKIDVFRGKDVTNLMNNVVNAYTNMKDTPLFKYLTREGFLDVKADPLLEVGLKKGISGAERASLLIRAINLESRNMPSEFINDIESHKQYKDHIIATHIKRAQGLVDLSEIYNQLEVRLSNQGVSPKELQKLFGRMIEDQFVGLHILQMRFHTVHKKSEANPYVGKWIKSQLERLQHITKETGEVVPLDRPTQQVLEYAFFKMLFSGIVPGEKAIKRFGTEYTQINPEGKEVKGIKATEEVKKLAEEYGIPKEQLDIELQKMNLSSKARNIQEYKIKDIEKLLKEGLDDAAMHKVLSDITNISGLSHSVAKVYEKLHSFIAGNINLWNSEHIPSSYRNQILKDLTSFIEAAESYGPRAESARYVAEIFKSRELTNKQKIEEMKKTLDEIEKKVDERLEESAKRIDERLEKNVKIDLANQLKKIAAKKAELGAIKNDFVSKTIRDKNFKKIVEIEKNEEVSEKEFLKRAQEELEKDEELKRMDEELFNEFDQKTRDKIDKKAVQDITLEYGSSSFINELFGIASQYGRPTAMAIAKKAIRRHFSDKDKSDLYALNKSEHLQTIEELYDPTKPVVETIEMAREFAKLEKLIEKNPDLLITIEGLMTELSTEIGWKGIPHVGVDPKDTELPHLQAFNRFIEDMYIAKGSLLDKVKKKMKEYGSSEESAAKFKKAIEEDASIPAEMKSIYHLIWNEAVGQKLRTHEMELYEKKNVPVYDKNGKPAITNRTLTLPTSTLEMVRLMVDQGKTLNTALSGFAEGHLKEAFEFIDAKDTYLQDNFRDIFKQAVRIREYDANPDKNSLHFGDPRFGNLDLDKQSQDYLRESYQKAKEYIEKVKYLENGELRKYTILDPDKPGQKKQVGIEELIETINEKITNFYELYKDKFIMKNFTQKGDKWQIDKNKLLEVLDENGFLNEEKMLSLLDLSTKYSGANIDRMLQGSIGMNEILHYQYLYGLKKTVQQQLAEKQGIKPEEVDLSSEAAQKLRDRLYVPENIPMVNLVVDNMGRPSSYWNHTGHSRYQANAPQIEMYIQERLSKYSEQVQSEQDLLGLKNIHSKLYQAAQAVGGKSKVLESYLTWKGAKNQWLKDKRAAMERGLVNGQREDGGYSDGIAHMIQSRNPSDVFGYLNGSMLSKDSLIMPGYEKSYDALTTYHKNFLKTYIDNLVGFRSSMLIDKFEQARKLGEHTEAWSGYMRDALTNMLGLSTFRSLEIQGMKKAELSLLKEYLESGLDRGIFSGRLKYEEKRFLDMVDSMTSPDAAWISQQAKRFKDPEMLDDAILQYRSDRIAEFAKETNVNKIKRFGTLYNVFSDEVVVNTVRKFEKRMGGWLGQKDFVFFKDTKGLTEDSRRMVLAQRAKAISNFEGKWELLSLLSHPKTLITNMLGGGINIYSDVGIGTFRSAMSEKDVLAALKGAEFQVVKGGKVIKRPFRNMRDVEEWIEQLGILDSMFTQEVGMNPNLIKFGNSRFVKEAQEVLTRRLNETPEAKTDKKLYAEVKDKTLRELSKKHKLFDQMVHFGGMWMQYSERKLRRTAFLAHYLNARESFGPEMLRHMSYDNVALIEIAKRGVEASQFMYHSAFRTNYSNTAMGRIMTRFHPYAWNSIKRRRNIYKYGAKYTGFIADTAANKKFQRQFTADLMSLALANVFIASIFEYALSPPMNWMQDMAGLMFGDAKERERAFFSQWPHPIFAPLQIATPPAARYVLPPVNAMLTGDWESFQKYQSWTYLPFGRALRDMKRIYDSPAMAPDFATGIPLHRMHEMRREAIAERKAEKEAEMAEKAQE